MRRAAIICVGLATALTAHGRAVVSKATIEDCLTEAGVPIDTNGSSGWERDAAPFNVRVPYTPVAISVPTTVEHIKDSVICGKKLGIKVSAKSGGHSYASLGFGGENGHLVVELDRMYGVSVDPVTHVATVQPGARLGHLATVLYNQYNRAVAHGTCPGVGISGHFLHGGFGFSSHKHGLALDSVVGATVVLADGNIVEASESENTDLFWAIRGAGSNFGIVASWRLATFEAPTVLTKISVSLGWTKSTAVAGLEALEQYAKYEMPTNLNFRIAAYSSASAGLEGLYYGPSDEALAAIAPLLEKAAPNGTVTEAREQNWIQAVIGYSNYEDIDFTFPSPQENFYAKSLTLKGLSGTSAQNFVDYWLDEATQITERFWFFQLDVHGGDHSAVSQVPHDSTAYAHRDKLYIIQFYDRLDNNAGDWREPEWFEFLDGWVDATTEPLAASDWGAYANYADANFDRAEAQRLYYGSHLQRLQQLKARYDPTELFYYPQSIQPSG